AIGRIIPQVRRRPILFPRASSGWTVRVAIRVPDAVMAVVCRRIKGNVSCPKRSERHPLLDCALKPLHHPADAQLTRAIQSIPINERHQDDSQSIAAPRNRRN
ncbi:MAG: hypothetical protein Q3963_07065, partial [Coriobacteriaceae bacterium]|nr:hypothetical protein [Coriobacteriaceae bacterium]